LNAENNWKQQLSLNVNMNDSLLNVMLVVKLPVKRL
jgi:hypothetical protein